MAATTSYPPSTSYFPHSPHPSSPSLRDTLSPRPLAQSGPTPARTDADAHMAEAAGPITPTRSDFAGVAGQKPLPSTPFSPSQIVNTPGTDRSDTDRDDIKSPGGSTHVGNEHEDVEMGDDADQDESEDDSVGSDGQLNKKKKKGQRFFCTDYPPCNLSFTRSEHLARHIRKHTGERPFQCHCGRRFSRLDNLRQHAQTVHVNEEIPGDSLAATGTRFQRQIRTDRVRAPGGRARAGTGPSVVGHARGHSRNMSTSSVNSTASTLSAMPDDIRRRPPPLAMAQDNNARRIVPETYVMPGAPPPQYGYYPQSPTGFSTPTSATFSTAGNSPRFSGQSPTMGSRAAYFQPPPTARRLSVPSAASPYAGYNQGYMGTPTGPYHSSTASTSSIASPRASMYAHARRDSEVELEWRRRTWHPGTYAAHVQRPATSGLSYQQTPDDARPTTAGQPAASQITRLPGIESFDHALPQLAAASNRPPSPMRVDAGPSESRAPGPDDRRSNSVWEASLHQNLNRLDIAGNTPPRSNPAVNPSRPALPAFSFPQAPASIEPTTPENTMANRRHGWFGGPMHRSQPINIGDRASPVESASSDGVPTPSTSHGREAHPAIVHAPHEAMVEDHHAAMHPHEAFKPGPARADSGSHLYAHVRSQSQAAPYTLHSGYDSRAYPLPSSQPGNGMGRLEALVAVATSENRR